MPITLVLAAAALVQPQAPQAPAQAVPVITPDSAFWTPRLDAIRHGTLDANRHQCEITGRYANFDRAAAKLKGDANPGAFEGLLFNDSDVYKVMEGWAWAIAAEPDAARKAALDRDLDALIARVAAAQLPDGYIDTYYTLKVGLDKRFTREEWDHETYCMGHLIEAGVGHAEALGKKNLLGVALKAADFLGHLYADTDKGFSAPPGHQEVELALIRLADYTGQQKYAALAHKLVELRGKPHRKPDGTMYGPWGDYAQDQAPAAQQREVAGHSVRAGYFYSAMADLARRGHPEYTPAVRSLWDDITQRRVFVTGGIGPSGHNEGFTVPYDIPTRSAYQETCASIALCLFAHRMFLLTGDASYMEQFESTLYNAALAGVSLDGSKFFYVNPMECVPTASGRGAHQRVDWFSCACCPPNVLRFFGQLGRYAYTVRDGVVHVNLFVGGRATVPVDGGSIEITQQTNYPFSGAVKIAVHNTASKPVEVAIRDGSTYRRSTVPPGIQSTREFVVPMTVARLYADPRVKASLGRVAVKRGPLIYAAESIDNGSMQGVFLPPTAEITEQVGQDGVPVLIAKAARSEMNQSRKLYEPAPADAKSVKLTLRPYFMWGNRGKSEMRVWIPESPQFTDQIPVLPEAMKGLKSSASYVGHGDGPEAAHDGVLPESSSDQTPPRFTFWPHKGKEGASSEWLQYSFDKPRAISSASVYWFDDTGVGECRLPASCKVEYLDGKDWKPVPAKQNGDPGAIGVAKDQLNTIAFDAVTTTAIRLNIQLRDKYSTGILEFTVGGP